MIPTNQAGGYTVLATNAVGSATSSQALLTVVVPIPHYVAAAGTNPVPPYINRSNAAPTIQQALDASASFDEIVVSNGTYNSGGRAVFGLVTNRVAADHPLTLRSVNGPQFTIPTNLAVGLFSRAPSNTAHAHGV